MRTTNDESKVIMKFIVAGLFKLEEPDCLLGETCSIGVNDDSGFTVHNSLRESNELLGRTMFNSLWGMKE